MNALKHGMYAETNKTYTKIFTDEERSLTDRIFTDYVKRYTERHGEPPLGHETKLFAIAVNLGKEIHGENWAVEKSAALEAGNLLVDRETRLKTTADSTQIKEQRYKQTAVLTAQTRLSTNTRQWLKDLELLNPESQQAETMRSLGAAIKQVQSETTDADQ